MTKKGDWSTVWEVQYLDPQFKMEMEGQPVPTNAPVAIVHCATREYLALSESFGRCLMNLGRNNIYHSKIFKAI
jgi:hypothetical protein